MNRTQAILGILLVAQALLILLVRSPLSDASAPEPTALLEGGESFSAQRLELEGRDAARVSLVKQGDAWTVEELDGFPADRTKVETLIGNMEKVRLRRPVISSGRYHDAFKVTNDENEGRVKIWGDPDAEPDLDLIVGTSPNYRSLHVRRAGEDPVYEARGLAAYDMQADPNAWIDGVFVDVPVEQLVGLTVRNAKGAFELVRTDLGWTVPPTGEAASVQLDADAVDTLVRAAASIRLAAAIGPSQSAESPADTDATVTLRYKPDPSAVAVEEIEVWIGAKLVDDDTRRSVSRSGFGFTGAVQDSSVSVIVENALEDLITG